jgi:hypothetical protein
VITILRKTSSYSFSLLYLILICLISGYFILRFLKISLSFVDFSALVLCFALITYIVLLVFIKGNNRDPQGRTMHILTALGIKILAELVLALIWFFAFKKNSLSSLIIFFVLYLAFSLFSTFFMLNTLKYKSL